MAYSHVFVPQITTPSGSLSPSKSYSASSNVELSETVANGQTNLQINVALDVSAVKSFYLYSSVAVTFETNDGSSPDDTIALKAGVPYIWNTDSYDSFLLGTDVTAIFITNASGSSASIELRAIQDATP